MSGNTTASQARREIARAQERLNEMRHADDFEAAELAWLDCIRHVDRAYNKIEAAYKNTPGYLSWDRRDRVKRDRKRDPLIQYVQQARNADEHTLAETTQHEPASVGIGAQPGSSVYIERMEVSGGEVKGTYQGDLQLTFRPDRLRLMPVINRGRTYYPPGEHLGTSLGEPGPADVAAAAISYYERYLEEAEERFGRPGNQ